MRECDGVVSNMMGWGWGGGGRVVCVDVNIQSE